MEGVRILFSVMVWNTTEEYPILQEISSIAASLVARLGNTYSGLLPSSVNIYMNTTPIAMATKRRILFLSITKAFTDENDKGNPSDNGDCKSDGHFKRINNDSAYYVAE